MTWELENIIAMTYCNLLADRTRIRQAARSTIGDDSADLIIAAEKLDEAIELVEAVRSRNVG